MKNKIFLFCLFMKIYCVGMVEQMTSRFGKFVFEKSTSFLTGKLLTPSLGFLGKAAIPYFFPAAETLLPLALTGSTFLFGLKKDGLVDRYLPLILAGTGAALVSEKPYMTGTFLTAMYLYYRKKKHKQAEELTKKFELEKASERKKVSATHEKERMQLLEEGSKKYEKLGNEMRSKLEAQQFDHDKKQTDLKNNLDKRYTEERLLLIDEHQKEIANKEKRIESLLKELHVKVKHAENLTDRQKKENETAMQGLSKRIIFLQKELEGTKEKLKEKGKGFFQNFLQNSLSNSESEF